MLRVLKDLYYRPWFRIFILDATNTNIIGWQAPIKWGFGSQRKDTKTSKFLSKTGKNVVN